MVIEHLSFIENLKQAQGDKTKSVPDSLIEEINFSKQKLNISSIQEMKFQRDN